MLNVVKGDKIDALLTLTNPENVEILQVHVQMGTLCKKYEAPVFPLQVHMTEEDTLQLPTGACFIYVAVWLDSGKRTSLDVVKMWVHEAKVCS